MAACHPYLLNACIISPVDSDTRQAMAEMGGGVGFFWESWRDLSGICHL